MSDNKDRKPEGERTSGETEQKPVAPKPEEQRNPSVEPIHPDSK